MPDLSAYHLSELEIVRDLNHPQRALPAEVGAGWRVLDIGCGIGQSLTAPEFSECASRHGIDVDAGAIEVGKAMFPDLDLVAGAAESLPYPDASFDLTFSRVALPYTNVSMALREIDRVTKPGGRVWFALHPWAMERRVIVKAIKTMNVRAIIDRSYVCVNSISLAATGYCFPRPWSGRYETFQLVGSICRLMRSVGFQNVRARNDRHFVVEATTGSGSQP